MINMAKTSSKINKQKEIEKKKRKKRKTTLIFLMFILTIGGICAYLLMSPSFNIQEISVIGNKQLTRQQVLSLAEINNGDNIFSKIGIVTKVRLKHNGYIEDAIIRKIYPNKVEIEIVERQKQFQIKTETEGYVYIDEQGYILAYGVDKLEIPTIIGIDVKQTDVSTKKRLDEKDLNKMENILQIREQFKNIEIADKITQYQVEKDYIITLENEGITINLRDCTNLKERMDFVNGLLKQEAGHKGTIYINGNINEGFSAYFSEQ